jgi:hypothetical protein
MADGEANVVFLETPDVPSATALAPDETAGADAAVNRLCLALAEAAREVRYVKDLLVLEAEAMRMAIDAIERVDATALACSRNLLDQRLATSSKGDVSALVKPLGLAASATLAINASIASSGNTLAEVSLRVIRAGELFLEASRCASTAVQVEARASGGKVQAADMRRAAR